MVNCEWSTNLAYAVGLLATDGNLSKDKRHILFTTTEKQLACLFKTCLPIKNKTSITPASGFGTRRAYRINFGDVKFYRWLKEIGITPNKSLSIKALSIPKKYFSDFLRGHLDGDGSVFTYVDRYRTYKGKRYTYNRLYTSFISSSYPHIKWLQSRIKNNLNIEGALNFYRKKDRKNIVWQLRFAKNDSLKLLSWLYYKPNLPCLTRKRKIAERFLKTNVD